MGFWESRVLTQIENVWANIQVFMISVYLCLALTIEEAPGPFFVCLFVWFLCPGVMLVCQDALFRVSSYLSVFPQGRGNTHRSTA